MIKSVGPLWHHSLCSPCSVAHCICDFVAVLRFCTIKCFRAYPFLHFILRSPIVSITTLVQRDLITRFDRYHISDALSGLRKGLIVIPIDRHVIYASRHVQPTSFVLIWPTKLNGFQQFFRNSVANRKIIYTLLSSSDLTSMKSLPHEVPPPTPSDYSRMLNPTRRILFYSRRHFFR